MSGATSRQRWLAVGLLVLVAWAGYANSFRAEFHFDDYTYIVNKPELRDIGDWRSVYRALGHPSRFITFYTFAINYHFHDYDVFGYHLVNWLIHLANGVLVWIVMELLWHTPCLTGILSPRRKFVTSLLAALIFTAHPLQTEAVTYVVQRFTSLATLFYLGAVASYLRGRLSQGRGSWGCYAVFALCTLLGMFTKQICFTIPVMILFLELSCFGRSGEERRRYVRLLPVLGLMLLIIPSFFRFNAGEILGREVPSRSHTGETLNGYTYALTQTRVVPTYLRLFVWPRGQTLDYDFPSSRRWYELKVVAGLLLLLGWSAVAWAVRRTKPWVAVGTAWFFITIAVTSSVIPIPHVIFEHRMYLPSVGLCLLCAAGLGGLIRNDRHLISAGAVLVAVLTLLTYQRNAVWRTEAALWADIINKAPGKLRAYNNLGMAELQEGRAAESLVYFDQALARNPGAGRVYNNRGLAYLALGDEERALADFSKAIALFEGSRAYHEGLYKRIWAQIYFNRGHLRLKRGEETAGREDLLAALQIDPRHPAALYALGSWHERAGEYEAAAEYYRRLLDVDPRHTQALTAFGYLLQAKGDDRGSLEYFNRALRQDPLQAEALFFRAISRYNLKDTAGARADMEQSRRQGYQPGSAELRAARQTILGLE